MKNIGAFLIAFAAAIIAGLAWDSDATTRNRHWLEMVLRWFFFMTGMGFSMAFSVVFLWRSLLTFWDKE